MGYKALVRINSKRRMPLYAGTKLVSGDKGEYDKDGAESQFQSSCLALPCRRSCVAENQGEITRRVRSARKLRGFCLQRKLPRVFPIDYLSRQNAESIIRFSLASLLLRYRD